MTEGPGGSAEERVKVTDKRRVDPLTGEVRHPSGAGASGAFETTEAAEEAKAAEAAEAVEAAEVSALVGEITADLQRLQAEYANYRKRVDRDRELVRSSAVAGTLAELLPVLDDVGRAREHGELDGAFKAVGEALEATVQRLGLEPFGAVGDAFDPTVHEALTHTHSDEVAQATCISVYQPGYRFAGRVVRPARVGVADPD